VTTLEVVVAILMSLGIVASVGLLGQRTVHHRATAASIAAAASLAEQKLEELRALPNPASAADLTAGEEHRDPGYIDDSGALSPSLSGPFRRSWQVWDPATAAYQKLKRVRVSVEHTSNSQVHVELETYIKVS
jgi:Tfp pilus assembly protein PilV